MWENTETITFFWKTLVATSQCLILANLHCFRYSRLEYFDYINHQKKNDKVKFVGTKMKSENNQDHMYIAGCK